MAGMYSHLTDEQLAAEIAEYRTAIKAATIGGQVGVVASEGRRMELTRPDIAQARADLRCLEAELVRRGNNGAGRGKAIRVEIG